MNIASSRIEMLSAIGWYVESKNLALRNAVVARTPLSAQGAADLRVNYSQYFVSLGSATELLLETERAGSDKFRSLLTSALANGSYPDGEENYNYLRELRNSIVHRGLDISAAAHIDADRICLLAPETVAHRHGKRTHKAFGKYVLELISLCEQKIGPAIAQHLEELGVFAADIPTSDFHENYSKDVQASAAMPEHVKAMALQSVGAIDFHEVHAAFIQRILNALKPQLPPAAA